jgi:nucleotide-binding universal stress UspA family protein
MNIERILVAVNSPDGRDAAFKRGLALASSSGAELYVLHAVPVDQSFSSRGAERLQQMTDLRQRADDAGVRVHTVEQHGDAAGIIELHANAWAADLIVMGGEAQGGWSRGRASIAERVVRRTAVPTLVVPSDEPETSTDIGHALVALDLSPASEDVLRGAIGLTAPGAGRLTVLHTVRGLEAADAGRSPARWKVPEFRTHVLHDARRTLEGIVSNVPTAVDKRVHVAVGPAARTILEHAGDIAADVIVVGGSRGFKLLGSTALRVLRKNDRALLVIPSAPHRTRQIERQHAA